MRHRFRLPMLVEHFAYCGRSGLPKGLLGYALHSAKRIESIAAMDSSSSTETIVDATSTHQLFKCTGVHRIQKFNLTEFKKFAIARVRAFRRHFFSVLPENGHF